MTETTRHQILGESVPCPLCSTFHREGKECDACHETGTLTIERMMDYLAASQADQQDRLRLVPEAAAALPHLDRAVYALNVLRAVLEGKAKIPPEFVGGD